MSPTAQKAQPELWRHIVERPHDFDARRVLCDALLAEGNPLGEFMRQALLPKPQRDHARAKQLLEKHRDEWFPRPPFVSYKAQWAHVDSLLASGGIPDGHWLFPDLAALDWWEAHYPLREPLRR